MTWSPLQPYQYTVAEERRRIFSLSARARHGRPQPPKSFVDSKDNPDGLGEANPLLD
jgi:hypothetical protein